MRSRGLVRFTVPRAAALAAGLMALPLQGSVRAAAPVVTVSATGAKIQVTSSTLSEAIDALARVAGFKVTYEGARPAAMLFNTEIDTPSVAQTLFRLIDGQNLNYAATLDRTGRKVTTLMVLGTQSKTPAAASGQTGAARPQPFATPRGPRSDAPVVIDDDPVEDEPEAPPPPTPLPGSAVPPRAGPGGQATPLPPPPFTPRPLFASPFAPRPSPSPSPLP